VNSSRRATAFGKSIIYINITGNMVDLTLLTRSAISWLVVHQMFLFVGSSSNKGQRFRRAEFVERHCNHACAPVAVEDSAAWTATPLPPAAGLDTTYNKTVSEKFSTVKKMLLRLQCNKVYKQGSDLHDGR